MNYAHNNLSATLQFGDITQVDPATHKVKVAFNALDGMESDWLPVITMGAGGNQFYALPDVGAVAVCLMNAMGDGGVVLGVVYNDNDATPTSNQNLWIKRFNNGTLISHDRSSGQVTVKTDGAVLIKSASAVTLDAPTVVITGSLSVQEKITALGDVVGSGVSLKSHTHGGVSGGSSRTGTP